MPWLILGTITIVVLSFACYSGVYVIYSRTKLERLAPRALSIRANWDGEADANRALLLIGDSKIAQWPLRPPPGWYMGKIGFPGEAAVNIEPAVRSELVQQRLYAVVIQAGGNDITAAVFQSEHVRAQTLARAASAVLAMAQTAREAGVNRVFVMSLVPPISPEWWKWALMGETQIDLLARLWAEIERDARAQGFEIFDAAALFRGPEGALRRDFRRDSSHWTVAAYTALNAALFAQLQKEPGANPLTL